MGWGFHFLQFQTNILSLIISSSPALNRWQHNTHLTLLVVASIIIHQHLACLTREDCIASQSPSFISAAILPLLLAVDPSPYLTGRDRLPWHCDVVLASTSFALTLHDHLGL